MESPGASNLDRSGFLHTGKGKAFGQDQHNHKKMDRPHPMQAWQVHSRKRRDPGFFPPLDRPGFAFAK
jgi:hypothetical protein